MVTVNPKTDALRILICEDLDGINGYTTYYHPAVSEHIGLAINKIFHWQTNDDTFEHELFHHFDERDGMTADDWPRSDIHYKWGLKYTQERRNTEFKWGSREHYAYKNPAEDQATMWEVVYSPTLQQIANNIIKKNNWRKTLAQKLRLVTGCEFIIQKIDNKQQLFFTKELFNPKRYQLIYIYTPHKVSRKQYGYHRPQYYAKRSKDPISKKILMNKNYRNAILQEKNVKRYKTQDGSYELLIL